MIYFITDGTGYVKIGYTGDAIQKRLASIQAHNPRQLELLCTFPGDTNLEYQIHRCLRKHWLHSEWFEKCEAIEDIVSYALDKHLREVEAIPSVWSSILTEHATPYDYFLQKYEPKSTDCKTIYRKHCLDCGQRIGSGNGARSYCARHYQQRRIRGEFDELPANDGLS